MTDTITFLNAVRSLEGLGVRIHWTDDRRPLFDAASILTKAGYSDVHKGTVRHLRRCPTPITKVRVSGRGYPFRHFLDTEGAIWAIEKANHREIECDPEDEWSWGATKEERSARKYGFLERFNALLGSGILERYEDLYRNTPTSNEIAECQSWIEEHKNFQLLRGGIFSEAGQKSFMLFSRSTFAEKIIEGGPYLALKDIWAT